MFAIPLSRLLWVGSLIFGGAVQTGWAADGLDWTFELRKPNPGSTLRVPDAGITVKGSWLRTGLPRGQKGVQVNIALSDVAPEGLDLSKVRWSSADSVSGVNKEGRINFTLRGLKGNASSNGQMWLLARATPTTFDRESTGVHAVKLGVDGGATTGLQTGGGSTGTGTSGGSGTGTGGSSTAGGSSGGGSSTGGSSTGATPWVNYAAPSGMNASTDYAVKVNGQSVFTYQTLPPASVSYNRYVHPSFAYFDHEGPVTVEVTALRPMGQVSVSPKLAGVPFTVQGNRITLTLPRPMKLVIESDHKSRTIDNHVYRPLFVIGNPIETERPAANDPNVVIFRGGQVHTLDRLPIDNNTTVYIEGGAVVRSKISVTGKKGWKIRGRGILDGQDTSGGNWNWFLDNEDVLIEGIIGIHGSQWNHPFYNSRGITIRNYKVLSNRGGDGFDFCGCQEVDLSDSIILSNDDNISIKINKRGTENNWDYSIRNTLFWNTDRGHAFVIGGELNNHKDPTGFVRDVVFQNNVILTARMSLDIFSSDNCEVSNVRYENVTIEDNDTGGHRNFLIKLESRNQNLYGNVDSPGGPIHDILYKGIHFTGPTVPTSVINAQDQTIRNVTFDSVTIQGRPVRSAVDLKLDNQNPAKTSGILFK